MSIFNRIKRKLESNSVSSHEFTKLYADVQKKASANPNGEACIGAGGKSVKDIKSDKYRAHLKKGEGRAIERIKRHLTRFASDYGDHRVRQAIANLDDLNKYGRYSYLQVQRALAPVTPLERLKNTRQTVDTARTLLHRVQGRKVLAAEPGTEEIARNKYKQGMEHAKAWIQLFQKSYSSEVRSKSDHSKTADRGLARQLNNALARKTQTTGLSSDNLHEMLLTEPQARVAMLLNELVQLEDKLLQGGGGKEEYEKIQHYCEVLITHIAASIGQIVEVADAVRLMTPANASMIRSQQMCANLAASLAELAAAHLHPESAFMKAYRLALGIKARAQTQLVHCEKIQDGKANYRADRTDSSSSATSSEQKKWAEVEEILGAEPDGDEKSVKSGKVVSAAEVERLLEDLLAADAVPSPRRSAHRTGTDKLLEEMSEQALVDYLLDEEPAPSLTLLPRSKAPIQAQALEPFDVLDSSLLLTTPIRTARGSSDGSRVDPATQQAFANDIEAFDAMLDEMDKAKVVLASRPGFMPWESSDDSGPSMGLDTLQGRTPGSTEQLMADPLSDRERMMNVEPAETAVSASEAKRAALPPWQTAQRPDDTVRATHLAQQRRAPSVDLNTAGQVFEEHWRGFVQKCLTPRDGLSGLSEHQRLAKAWWTASFPAKSDLSQLPPGEFADVFLKGWPKHLEGVRQHLKTLVEARGTEVDRTLEARIEETARELRVGLDHYFAQLNAVGQRLALLQEFPLGKVPAGFVVATREAGESLVSLGRLLKEPKGAMAQAYRLAQVASAEARDRLGEAN